MFKIRSVLRQDSSLIAVNSQGMFLLLIRLHLNVHRQMERKRVDFMWGGNLFVVADTYMYAAVFFHYRALKEQVVCYNILLTIITYHPHPWLLADWDLACHVTCHRVTCRSAHFCICSCLWTCDCAPRISHAAMTSLSSLAAVILWYCGGNC